MLKLKNVSKYYYNKGAVTSGFNKVNLELEVGEFVVITGESGSGKSTLLNVISGLDTYEDGEMYINGLETSHYNEADFEEYRKKYIGNIFQHFNLVNSYTVYQNIELVLLLNGFKRSEVKERILDIIKKVDLTKFKNTKASKLSGGQKQRVAIARALAKETSIIVADEPTGNLDSESSKSILELLHSISKDKLVVIVTHNYDQVEQYATRKIKMHDGKILEDKRIVKINTNIEAKSMDYKDMNKWNEIKIGLRNTFNVIPKFLLLLVVFLFITLSITGEYTSFQKRKYQSEQVGINQYFTPNENRIIIKKNDKTAFSQSEYDIIKNLTNVGQVIKNDLSIDTNVSINDDYYYYYGKLTDIELLDSKIQYGRLPENDYEVVIMGGPYDYDLNNRPLEIIDKEYLIKDDLTYFSDAGIKVKVVGIGISDEDVNQVMYGNQNYIYASNKLVEEIAVKRNISITKTITKINDKDYESDQYGTQYKIYANSKVPEGSSFVSKDLRMLCKNYRCLNRNISIKFQNLYFEDTLNVKITKEYTNKNFKSLTGLKNYDEYNGIIFVNPNDLDKVFAKGFFQSSVLVTNPYKIDETISALKELNYNTLKVKDAIVTPYMEDLNALTEIFQVVFISILTFALFFLSYFIIKLILKSRNIYFSTIRILGASKKVAKRLLDIELFTVLNVAYLIFLGFVILVKTNTLKIKLVADLTEFLKIQDYIIVYLILLFMSYLISNRYAKKLFKKSAMNTYREEV